MSALRSRTPGRDASAGPSPLGVGDAVPVSVAALEEEVAFLQTIERACGEGCTQRHEGACLVCGEDYRDHCKHECPAGGRGRWGAGPSSPTSPHTAKPGGTWRPATTRAGGAKRGLLGKKTSCCYGMCLPSPDSTTFAFILLIVVVPVGFFVAHQPSLLVRTVALLLALCQLAAGFLATLIDPGVVPAEYRPQPAQGMVPQFLDGQALNAGDVVVEKDGVQMIQRWCATCGMVRPLRAAHCSDCDVCVKEFDHHCPVIGSCVGERTFRFFAMFLWFTAALAWWVAVFTIKSLSATWPLQARMGGGRRRGGSGNTLQTYQMLQIMLVIYTIFVGICVTLFGFFYCTLTCSNQTERENFKNKYGARNPFDKGPLTNFRNRICTRLPPSHITDDLLKERTPHAADDVV